MNPFYDTVNLLKQSRWPIYLLWLLLLAGIMIAAYDLKRDPAQRTFKHLWIWIARVLLGCMWWQQTLWKLPPFKESGLRYWMEQMVKYAAFEFQSDIVKNLVLPNYYAFAPIVYSIEVIVAATLILGLFTRFGGVLGALFAINLWLGLYNQPSEWPWTYFFLILLQFTFGFLQSGRSLGIDAILARRSNLPDGTKSRKTKLINLLT
jgi:uncharacterized membrane protein YphA (DoxX/SURF4 family)